MPTLYEEVLFNNHDNLKNPALYFENKVFSYQSFFSHIKKMISYFQSLGIKENDVVTVALPNLPTTIFAFYALNAIGVVQNIIHPLSKIEMIIKSMHETNSKFALVLATEYNYLKECSEKVIFVNPMHEQSVFMRLAFALKFGKIKRSDCHFVLEDYLSFHEVKEVNFHDDERTSILLHSGGTTGSPKIIELSNRSLNNLARKVPYIVNENLENKSMLAVLPTFHGFGLGMGIHAPLANRASSSLMMKFNSKKIIKWINQGKINMIIGVPLLYQKLMKDENFLKSKLNYLEFCFVGGDNVQINLINEFNRLMKENGSSCLMLEGYGLTETVTVCTVNTRENFKIGSVGQGLNGIEIQIRDENKNLLLNNEIGEVYIHGNTLMNGYYLDQKATDATLVEIDGKPYIKTGDLGYLDEAGFLFLKGRMKRMFKLSGINIYPLEIEKIALENNDVYEASMEFFANPKPHTVLYLIKNKKSNKSDEDIINELYSVFNERLIKYSIPTKIVFLDHFPQTLVGKIDHNGFKDVN